MPTYNVTVMETYGRRYLVTADTAEEAEEIAIDLSVEDAPAEYDWCAEREADAVEVKE